MEKYQQDLVDWLKDIKELPNEIISGTPVQKPFPQELKDPDPKGLLNAKYPTTELFKKYTGTNHATLLQNWAKGGIMTTCNGFVGQAGRIMGAKDFLGQFELKDFLTKIGKGYAFVDSLSGRKPNLGDLFRSESYHMGVSLGFSGDEWMTVEAGQGGPAKGCDAIHRKRKPFVPQGLKGWCDMRSYLTATPPMPDWMVGTWVIYCGDETHHYEINYYGEVNYFPWKPIGDTANQKPIDVGSVYTKGMDNFSILWQGEGGIENFKYERFDSFPGIMEKISGTSSRNEPLRGVRL